MNLYDNLKIKINGIKLEELISIHTKCDNDFVPKLSSRVNIIDYCNKLIKNAEIISLHKEDLVFGIVAIYCNDNLNKKAFISSICLVKEFRGFGYSNLMMEKAIELVKSKNFKTIQLEVGKDNRPAINLYKKFGYNKIDEKSETIMMAYEIE